ncbi:hypothetical protein LPJ66_008155 [Kickxella alabastrina]|uniref:Uncharacterized protein n=1 Tax=Kickxella alabastrina TaxID=61397 RepID=A0ACC1IAN6_9FUNG|nr:hypothetical protein LPJ66_008155 [Kickxella alabastrina]
MFVACCQGDDPCVRTRTESKPHCQQRLFNSKYSARRALNSLLIAVSIVLAAAPLYGCHAASYDLQKLGHSDGPTGRLPRAARADGLSRLVPRATQYSQGVSMRWSHASAIADQTMYILGGKKGYGNAESDYATSCISLKLSGKFSTSNPPWEWVCDHNGPLVAGHSVIINDNINMAVVFGGTVPDEVERIGPMHLFSAEIGFWSTPNSLDFPQPLVGHSAVIQHSTGDMLVYGGSFDTAPYVLSNATLGMVTDIQKHNYASIRPSVGFSSIKPLSGVSDTSTGTTTTEAASKTRASTIKDGSASSSQSSTNKGVAAPTSISTTKTTGVTQLASDDVDARGLELRGIDDDIDNIFTLDDNASSGPLLMAWTNDMLPASVSGRTGHTASMVNDTNMVILGGSDGNRLVGMGTVYVYNGLHRMWYQRTATGNVPASRRNHVATVVNGTHIAVHGGATIDFGKALGDVAVLDTDTWVWSAPNVSGAPAARFGHAASQAGPYMIMTFGRTVSNQTEVDLGDYGLYLLDTSVWKFVAQFDPSQSALTVNYKSAKFSGGTVFGLTVASTTGFLVILILLYILCMHHYNKHPQLSDSGENGNMLPANELRELGRRLTAKIGTQRQRAVARDKSLLSKRNMEDSERLISSGNHKMLQQMYPLTPTSPAFSHTKHIRLKSVPGIDDNASQHIMFDVSRSSSIDKSLLLGSPNTREKHTDSQMRNSKLIRRTHLDNVQLPTGLRNRDDLDGADRVEERVSVMSKDNGGGWSRPSTANSRASRKSKHISAMLPRVVGSRLTLPMETANALARYRFEELEDVPESPSLPQIPAQFMMDPLGNNATNPDGNGNGNEETNKLAPPAMPAAYDGAAWNGKHGANGSDSTSSSAGSTPDARGSDAQKQHMSPTLVRGSIDINMFSQKNKFFVANPDD